MSEAFMAGVLTAWTLTQLGFSAFFALAWLLGRREREYLLFALVCLALAACSAGLAYFYADTDLQARAMATRLSYAGTIAGCAINLHFVMHYAGFGSHKRVILAVYVLGLFFEIANASGYWWVEGTYSVRPPLGGSDFGLVLSEFEPTLFAIGFYAVGAIEILASLWLLARAFHSGKREALSSMVGAMAVAFGVGHDILMVADVVPTPAFLLPHAFLIYAFGVASTLLLRYRVAAAELELTISSLEERTTELRHSHAELRVIQDELGKKQQLAAVGELAAAIAHEVRNPLAVIVNAVAGLRRSGLPEKDRDILLGIIDEETLRLNRLVTDLLRFARPVDVKRSAVSLSELAQRTASVLGSQHKLEVSIPEDPDLQTIWVDPALFRLVFDNLVENACQAMKGGGTVEVVVSRGQVDDVACVSVEIRDSGRGMDPEVLDRAVDPFFTTRPSGTGLGLPIVHRIVEAHGGRLNIESDPGAGTHVTLYIPAGEGSPALPLEPAAIHVA